MKNKMIIITIVLVILAAGGGFFGGMKYQESKNPFTNRQLGSRQGGFTRNGQTPQNGNNGGSLRPVAGEIISSDASSITVKMQDGSSKIVILSDSTTISKSDQATKDDLKTGESVAVFGTQNPDGSVTAQNIQLNPEFRAAPQN